MSLSDNPFQDKETADQIYDAEIVESSGLWRRGNLLVMHKTARLPDRCVKSNVATQRKLRRDMTWHHPAIFFSILAGILIYVILALVLRKSASINIGLSDNWFAKRRRAILIAWILVLAAIGMITGGIYLSQSETGYSWLIFGGIGLILSGAIYGIVASRMVAPTQITDTHVWLKGVCPEFLEGLDEWPRA